MWRRSRKEGLQKNRNFEERDIYNFDFGYGFMGTYVLTLVYTFIYVSFIVFQLCLNKLLQNFHIINKNVSQIENSNKVKLNYDYWKPQ